MANKRTRRQSTRAQMRRAARQLVDNNTGPLARATAAPGVHAFAGTLIYNLPDGMHMTAREAITAVLVWLTRRALAEADGNVWRVATTLGLPHTWVSEIRDQYGTDYDASAFQHAPTFGGLLVNVPLHSPSAVAAIVDEHGNRREVANE